MDLKIGQKYTIFRSKSGDFDHFYGYFRVLEVSKWPLLALKGPKTGQNGGNTRKWLKFINFSHFHPLFGPDRPELIPNFTTKYTVFGTNSWLLNPQFAI